MNTADLGAAAKKQARLYIGVMVAVLVGLIILFGAFFNVAQYERGIVTTWGKLAYVAAPGLGFKIPLVQSVEKWRTDQLQVQPTDKVNTYTEDNQEINIMFIVYYQVPPENIASIYEHAQGYRTQLFSVANDRLKSEMGKVKLEHFASNRAKVRETILNTIKKDAKEIGIDVTDFQLADVHYTDAYRKAVEGTSVQKQGVETQEWKRQQAEKDAQTQRINAEGAANAVKEKAKGDAEATLVNAQAESKSIQMKGEATAKAMQAQAEALARNPVLVEMKKAEQWDGKLPVNMYSGTPIPLLNLK